MFGKTTLTVNLAAVAHDVLAGRETVEQSPILVVSTDPQASTVWWAECVGAGLPFDFAQADDDPKQLAKLKSTDAYQAPRLCSCPTPPNL